MDDLQDFLAQYESTNACLVIPDGLGQNFCALSCLKANEISQIYLLLNKQDNLLYILRVAPAHDLPRLMDEYHLLARLHDNAFPHPIACFSAGEHAYLLREYIPGKSLADYVENGAALSPGEAAKITKKVCAAVEKLHALKPPVIHRDIKPQNIILSPSGSLHLVDLDTAQEHCPEKSLDTIVMGTAATAAPEQFGYKRCDSRTDVYGVGMLMKYLLTGNYDTNPKISRQLAGGLSPIIRKCLKFDPGERYGSMAKLNRKITQYHIRWQRRTIAIFSAVLLALSVYGFFQSREAIALFTSNLTNIAPADAYQFVSPLVEAAVRLQLKRPAGSITIEDLASVSQLNLCGNTVYEHWDDADSYGADLFIGNSTFAGYGVTQDLTDLEYMPNLRKLSLYRLSLSDIHGIQSLPLTHLALGGNRISDLTPLANITTLMELDISDNPVTNLEPLRSCLLLRKLDMGATPVSDFSPLTALSLNTLRIFDLTASNIDYSALSELRSVKVIGARFLPPQGLDMLLANKSLQDITLFFCEFESLKIFSAMKELRNLNVSCSGLKSLDGVADLPALQYLDLWNDKITNVQALAGHPTLEMLTLAGNDVKDLTPLETLPNLKVLTLSTSQTDLAATLPKSVPYSVVYRD